MKIKWKNWVVIIALVIIPSVYFVLQLNDSLFVDSAMGNWFATMVGAISGIFIALELDRWQKRSEEKVHTKKILKLVKDELWNALSDGGELQWIQDLDLINEISSAYYFIRIIIGLEEKYFNSLHFEGGKFVSMSDHILKYLEEIDPQAISQIEKTTDEIHRRFS